MQDKIYGLILAAGYSSRFSSFKPLAKYKGFSFIQNIIKNNSSFCDEIVIVIGYKSELLKSEIDRTITEPKLKSKLKFIHNENYSKGMFSSIQSSAKYLKSVMAEHDRVLLQLVDQPHIAKPVYEQLLLAAKTTKKEVIIPSYEMHAGHPILFSKKIITEILSSPPTNTLKDVLNKFSAKYVVVNQKQIIEDIDRDEDFDKFL